MSKILTKKIKKNTETKFEKKKVISKKTNSKLDDSSKKKKVEKIYFKQLIPRLVETLSKGSHKEKHIFDAVQKLVESYDPSLGDWKKYEIWDKDRYTRNLIAQTKYFKLMLLCWPAKIKSPIHDHGNSECWLKVVTGALEENFYELPEKGKPLKKRFSKVQKAGSVCFINDNIGLHSIGNPTNKGSISLHCYVPGYDSCHAFFDEKNPDKKSKCYMSFTSINGKKVTH